VILFLIQEVNLDLVKVRRLQDPHLGNPGLDLHLDHLLVRLKRRYQIDLRDRLVKLSPNLVVRQKLDLPLNRGLLQDVQEDTQIEMLPMMIKRVNLHQFTAAIKHRTFGKWTQVETNIIPRELQKEDNMRCERTEPDLGVTKRGWSSAGSA
jgi:hypothetical protein